jgi:hypothetical protein
MKYLINQGGLSQVEYSREEVEQFIQAKKIGLNTEIWTETWCEWRKVKDADLKTEGAVDVDFVPIRNQHNQQGYSSVGSSRSPESQRAILHGGLLFFGGIIVTIGSFASAGPGESYVLAWGAIIFGAIKFFKGLEDFY